MGNAWLQDFHEGACITMKTLDYRISLDPRLQKYKNFIDLVLESHLLQS